MQRWSSRARWGIAAALLGGALGAGPAAAQADAGRAMFARCAACHSSDGTRRLGPSLAGLANRPAGEVAGFAYSPALKASGLRWDAATLDRFLAAPAKVVPGNRMIFPGIARADERARLVAYLMTLAAPALPPR